MNINLPQQNNLHQKIETNLLDVHGRRDSNFIISLRNQFPIILKSNFKNFDGRGFLKHDRCLQRKDGMACVGVIVVFTCGLRGRTERRSFLKQRITQSPFLF